ncbi:RNA polymerase sigma factor [Spirosoma endbachense]|uniref:RNA polymerase sigma factor n=1 Tax=Spirosoma endbachense TaxID=2666025 RepID=UPI001E51E28D|nr:sigma factor [Spirosoma endbachense]
MNIKQLHDEQLVTLFHQGSMASFEEIYQRYWYKLFKMAYHQVNVQEDAEELVQDIFMSLWKRRSIVIIKQLDLYLMLAVKNQIYKYIKSKISLQKYREYIIFQDIYQNHHTDDFVSFHELMDATEAALGRLPEKSAEVFRRSRFHN